MTGVQTCALPICQPVKGLAEAKKNIEDWKRIQREFNTTGSYTLDRDFGGYKAGTSLKQKDIEDGVQGAYSDQTKAVNVLTARFAALAEATDLIAGLFESFGGGDGMSMAGSVISGGASGASQVAGLAQSFGLDKLGMWGAAAGAAIGILEQVAQIHDKVLDKAIQKSKKRVEQLQMAYEHLGTAIERGLGIDGATERAIENYALLEKQMKRVGEIGRAHV